jgi:Na+/proline symporter
LKLIKYLEDKMPLANIQTLIGMTAYLVTIVIIGLWYARRNSANLEEYFLAKRGLVSWLAEF